MDDPELNGWWRLIAKQIPDWTDVLVFTDWLEERGYRDTAEALRWMADEERRYWPCDGERDYKPAWFNQEEFQEGRESYLIPSAFFAHTYYERSSKFFGNEWDPLEERILLGLKWFVEGFSRYKATLERQACSGQ